MVDEADAEFVGGAFEAEGYPGVFGHLSYVSGWYVRCGEEGGEEGGDDGGVVGIRAVRLGQRTSRLRLGKLTLRCMR